MSKRTGRCTSTVFHGKWAVGNFIHSGGFGETYMVKNIETSEIEVAKLERRDTAHPTLLFEYLLYKRFQDGPGIPRLIGYCEEGDFRVLVMERLGADLWHLIVGKQRKLSLTQTATVGLTLLDSLQHIHALGFVHRDIKPGNVMLGFGENANKVFLIDFGLAKKVISASTARMLIEDRYVKYRCGTTTRYASIRCLLGREQSFRDDIESLAYTLLELFLGKLPWGDYPRNDVFHAKQIFVTVIQNERIAQKKNIPRPFVRFLEYATHMKFSELPSYELLRSLLTECLVSERSTTASVRTGANASVLLEKSEKECIRDALTQLASISREEENGIAGIAD